MVRSVIFVSCLLLMTLVYSVYFFREAFSDDYMSLLHVTPPRSSFVPLSITGVPDELLESLKSAQPSGLDIRTGVPNHECARIMNALEVASSRLDLRVIYTCASRHVLVIYARNAISPFQDKCTFRCQSPGAEYMLLLIASTRGLKKGDLDFTSQDREIVTCSLVRPDGKDDIPANMRMLDYASKSLLDGLQVKAPYVRMTGVFVKSVYAKSTDQAIISLAGAEDMLVCPQTLAAAPPLAILSKALILHPSDPIDFRSNTARNTFYRDYFRYTTASKSALFIANSKIIEKFDDLEPNMAISGRVDVVYGGKVRIIVLPKNNIEGNQLRVGDRVTLTKQARIAENGTYFVASRDMTSAMLTSPPIIASINEAIRKEDVISFPRESLYAKGTIVYLVPYDAMGKVISPHEIQLLPAPNEIAKLKYDPKSYCVGDKTIAIKELCESPMDAMGSPKKQGIWDRPCVADAECPFFKIDRTYENVRGGCMDSGYCEMPVGVTAISFRHYTGEPIDNGTEIAFNGDKFDR